MFISKLLEVGPFSHLLPALGASIFLATVLGLTAAATGLVYI